jgi:hypothetical protein
MKPLMYLALILSAIYILISLPFLTVLWILGADSPFKNFTTAFNRIIFSDYDS